MKTRWDFIFEAKGILFRRPHKYRGVLPPELASRLGRPEAPIEFQAQLTVHASPYNPTLDHTGTLAILLSGTYEDMDTVAKFVASRLAQQISFARRCTFKVTAALITGERIAETPEEAEAIKEAPFFAEAHLVEADVTPTFEGSELAKLPAMDAATERAMRQFNSATAVSDPISRFIGLFKILEWLFVATGGSAASALMSSGELFDAGYASLKVHEGNVSRTPTRDDFNDLIRLLVEVRDQCSHLKKGLGVVAGEAEVRDRINPLLKPLEDLVHAVLRRRTATR